MRRVFADTFYWIALTNPRDHNHRQAITLSRNLQPMHIITTEDVLVEFLNYSGDRGAHSRNAAISLVKNIMSDPAIQVFTQRHETFLAGLSFYEQRPDKGYSLTDCLSMLTMHQEALSDALTNDRHFAQEGFRCLFWTES